MDEETKAVRPIHKRLAISEAQNRISPVNASPIVAAALILVTFSSVSGKMAVPEPVPVRKLVAIVEKAADANPTDGEAQFNAARTHYLAFVNGTDKLEAYTFSLRQGRVAIRAGQTGQFTSARDWLISEEASRRTKEEMKLKDVWS